MAQKDLLRQLELEKQKREMARRGSVDPVPAQTQTRRNAEGQQQAWELELEAYREQKKRERFFWFGAVCGVLSMVAELAFHGPAVMMLIKKMLRLG